jgi:hypothetical protein
LSGALLLAGLLLTGCGRSEESSNNVAAEPSIAPVAALASYAGVGRDRLCLAEADGRAGLVTYGEGDANCSLRGTVQRAGSKLTIIPEGDATCRIDATVTGDGVILGAQGSACSYYCGPTASFAGRSFTRMERPEPATDLTGEPLC